MDTTLFQLRLSVVIASLLVAGCQTVVTHPTKSAADFAKDDYECDKDVAAVQDRIRMVTMHRACMRQKGWVEQ